MRPEDRYQDRRHAGRVLAAALERYVRGDDVVLALPRGGVPVAYEVAARLRAPLDVFVVRKLGLPDQEEVAMGAIASGGVRVLNEEVIDDLGISESALDEVTAREQRELERRERVYRGDQPPLDLSGRAVILVDDGLATGFSMIAAAESVKQHRPRSILVAVPIAPSSVCEALSHYVDHVVCAATPEPFVAVGLWYTNFEQISDLEVRTLLDAARSMLEPPPTSPNPDHSEPGASDSSSTHSESS